MKVAADGKKKFTLLLTAPASRIPTATELNAGIDISCVVLDSDANWSPAASDKVDEKASCIKGNAQALGARNYDLGLTFLREWLISGGADAVALDKGWQALKKAGTEVWIYLRETDKDSTAPWAPGDEIHCGGRVVADVSTRPNNEGNIKRRIEFLPQDMITEEVAGPGAAPTVSGVTPASAATGATITITGTNLNATTAVTVGGNAATNVNVVSGTSVTATMPAGTAGSAPVVVTTPAGPSNSFAYTRG